MRPVNWSFLLAALLLAPFVASESSPALGQEPEQLEFCGNRIASASQAPAPLPALTAEGFTLEGRMDSLDDVRRYAFQVTQPSTAYVYLGDQWYDLDLGVFSLGERKDVACWRVERTAAGERGQRRLVQFIRPEERIVERLSPGVYILTVRPSDLGPAADFDPTKSFTLRVALGPPLCGQPNPPNDEPDQRYPQLKQRRDDPNSLWQLGVTFEPAVEELGPFALMTFSAFVSPPFTDLFDFEWSIDGQPVAGAIGPVVQRPFADLPKTPGGQHVVRLTGRGVREYKDPTDPTYNHLPLGGGTLVVECRFAAPGS